MNILYISYDGIMDLVSQSQIVPYLEGLSRKGDRIVLLSFEKTEKLKNRGAVDTFSRSLKEMGVIWIKRRYHKRPSAPATILDIVQGVAAGKVILNREKISIVHARGYIAALMGYILKRISMVRLIFDMRGFWPDEKVDAAAWRKDGMLYRIIKKMEGLLLRASDEVIVLTEAAKSLLLQRYFVRGNISVIPCCVDLGLFKATQELPPLDREVLKRPIILYAGNLGSFYGLDMIFDFFTFLQRKNKGFFLWIISNYPKDRIEKEALSNRVDRADYAVDLLEYRDMPKAFSRAAFSLIFYNRQLSGAGCSPIKLGESLACGVPVLIGPGIGDCDNIVKSEKVGVVMTDFSERGYEKAFDEMDKLLSEGDALKDRCMAVARKYFSLNSGINKFQDVYDRIGRI